MRCNLKVQLKLHFDVHFEAHFQEQLEVHLDKVNLNFMCTFNGVVDVHYKSNLKCTFIRTIR